MQFLIKQFYTPSSYFLYFRSKYIPPLDTVQVYKCLCISILMIIDSKHEKKRLDRMAAGISRILSAFNISCMKCRSVVVVRCCYWHSETFNVATLKKIIVYLNAMFCFAFCPQDMNVHSILSLFASSHCNNLTENSSCTVNFN
jgi:uncharacterized protein Smg (DUF494 family)